MMKFQLKEAKKRSVVKNSLGTMRFIHFLLGCIGLLGTGFAVLLILFFVNKGAALALIHPDVREANARCGEDLLCLVEAALEAQSVQPCTLLDIDSHIRACEKLVIQQRSFTEDGCGGIRSLALRQECLDRKQFEHHPWSVQLEPIINDAVQTIGTSDRLCIKTILHSQIEDFDAKVYVWYSCAKKNNTELAREEMLRGIAAIRLQKREQWSMIEVNTSGYEIRDGVDVALPEMITRRGDLQKNASEAEFELLVRQNELERQDDINGMER